MDIKGIRNLNLIGTILFGLIGCGIPLLYMSYLNWILSLAPFGEGENPFGWCTFIFFIWAIFVLGLAILIYNKTVKTIDNGDYATAKQWTVYAIIIGFLFGGGIITLIVFLISHMSWDDALRQLHYGQYPPQYGQPPQYGYGYQQPPPGQPPQYGYGYQQPPPGQPPQYPPPGYQQPGYQQAPPAPSRASQMMGRHCPHCGNLVENNWTACRHCAGKL
jgi:hypothetical protein